MPDLRRVIPADRPTRLLAAATLVNTFGNGLFFTVSVVYFTRVVGLSAHELGVGLAAAGIAGILAGIPAGHLADRLGAREVMIALTLVSACWMAAFALVSGFAGFVLVGCLYAFFDRGAGAVRQALIAAVVPGDGRVRTRAYLRSVTNVGIGAGSLVAGAALVLDVRAGYLALILVNALTFLGAVVLIARLPHQAPVRREVPASRGTEEVRPAALALRTSGWLVLAACVVFAASAGPGPLAAVALLLLGALIHVVGEMRQSAGGWGVAFGLAPDALQGQYQGLFSTSMAASHAIGPLLMTALPIAFGTAGWVALGLVVVAVSVASVPVADWGLRTRSMAV